MNGIKAIGAEITDNWRDLCSVVSHDFRKRWWAELEVINPVAARRLIEKFPDRYPVQ